ncbi:MAG: hypothetical protein U0401_23210 [Anaerolineae bacterium]
MVADVFSMSRDDFLRDFSLDDKLLPLPGRLEQITTRFLRHIVCSARMTLGASLRSALLRKGAEVAALAVWGLADRSAAQQVLQELHLRYAFCAGLRPARCRATLCAANYAPAIP